MTVEQWKAEYTERHNSNDWEETVKQLAQRTIDINYVYQLPSFQCIVARNPRLRGINQMQLSVHHE